ncbi:MAG: repeat protein [Planctomycetaceae bacterium]|nr:repeat protein [Planctomycetaceae bacterium]
MNYSQRVSLLAVLLMLLSARVSVAADPGADAGGKPVPVWCLDFSPDGSLLAAGGGDREGAGILQLWNTTDWTSILAIPEDRALTCVAFSPDGRSLAVGTQKGQFAIFDIASKKTAAFWESGKWAVYGVTWTPDGNRIIGACANGAIKVWDAKTQALQVNFDVWQADGIEDPGLRGHADRNQWDVAVTADGKTLISGGWNDTTRVWSLATQKLIRSFSDEDKSTQGVKLMPDEKHFVSAGMKTGCVRIRDTKTFRERMTLPVSGRDLAVHPNGSLIAASSMTDVRVYRVNLELPGPAATSRANEFIKQLDAVDPRQRANAIQSLKEMGPCIEPLLDEIMRSKSEKLIDQVRELWETLRTATEVAVLGDLKGEVRQVVFSPTGKFLAASTLTGEVRVWTVPDFVLHQSFIVKSVDPIAGNE